MHWKSLKDYSPVCFWLVCCLVMYFFQCWWIEKAFVWQGCLPAVVAFTWHGQNSEQCELQMLPFFTILSPRIFLFDYMLLLIMSRGNYVYINMFILYQPCYLSYIVRLFAVIYLISLLLQVWDELKNETLQLASEFVVFCLPSVA